MVVPWSLPDDLQADSSEPRAAIKKMFKIEVRQSWTVWTADPLYVYYFHNNSDDFSWRICWETLTSQSALSWLPSNLRTSRTKQRLCLCLLMPPKLTTCRCPLKISWITFAPWTRATSRLQILSFTGTVSVSTTKSFKLQIVCVVVCHLFYSYIWQVLIFVPRPDKLCVPVTLCASAPWALTAVCANMATMMWAPSSSLLWLHILSATVRRISRDIMTFYIFVLTLEVQEPPLCTLQLFTVCMCESHFSALILFIMLTQKKASSASVWINWWLVE